MTAVFARYLGLPTLAILALIACLIGFYHPATVPQISRPQAQAIDNGNNEPLSGERSSNGNSKDIDYAAYDVVTSTPGYCSITINLRMTARNDTGFIGERKTNEPCRLADLLSVIKDVVDQAHRALVPSGIIIKFLGFIGPQLVKDLSIDAHAASVFLNVITMYAY